MLLLQNKLVRNTIHLETDATLVVYLLYHTDNSVNESLCKEGSNLDSNSHLPHFPSYNKY